jgi:hypothetical protein
MIPPGRTLPADSVAQGRFSMTSMDVPADRPVASLPLKD